MDQYGLVDALRAVAPHDGCAELCAAAANEIERLRIQRDDLVSFLSGISRQTENMARSYENGAQA